jgi:hypothetical protein
MDTVAPTTMGASLPVAGAAKQTNSANITIAYSFLEDIMMVATLHWFPQVKILVTIDHIGDFQRILTKN